MALFGGVTIPGHPDLENIRKLDLMAISMIRRCQRIGIAIDPPYFADLGSQFSIEITKLEKDIASYIPADKLNAFADAANSVGADDEGDNPDFNAGSAEQIGKLLFELLGLGADKDIKMTKGGRLSTGKKQLELIRLEHPIVPLILRHRELKKLVTTYCNGLPKLAKFHPRGSCCPICELMHDSDQWRIHGEMGTTRADTGRINHKNPNLGNIPTRTKDGQAVQAGFIAPPGKRLINCDLSQIELRDLAHLANCSSMIAVYAEDGDIHDDTCHKALGVPMDEKPDKYKHRMAAKRVNFGIQNGTTEKGLYLQLVMDFGTNGMPIPDWLTEPWCKQFIVSWLESRPEVHEYFEQQWYRTRRYEMAWDAFGRVRLIPEIRSQHSWIREAGLRYSQNLPVTSTAAGQLKLAMGKSDMMLQQMYDAGVWCWPLLTIHDAIKVEADEDIAEDVLEVLGLAMDTCMTDEETGEHMFRVPMKSDGEITQRWAKK